MLAECASCHGQERLAEAATAEAALRAWIGFAVRGPGEPACQALPGVLAAMDAMLGVRGQHRGRVMRVARWALTGALGALADADGVGRAFAATGDLWGPMNTSVALSRLAHLCAPALV